MDPFAPKYDLMLQRALEHYRRGELDEALELLQILEASDNGTPESRDLLTDIGLQQKLIQTEVSFLEPPKPPRPIWPAIAIAAGLTLLLVGGGALAWLRPWERPALAATPTAVAVVAAPTVAPTAAPTAEPTAAPTVAPTTEPTAAPTAEPTAAPTAEPTAPGEGQATGTLAVRMAAGQDSVLRTPRNIAIILDASGSMRAQVGDQQKMAIAREALGATVAGLPDDTLLAVRTYGNQRTNDCSDLSLLQPLGIHDRAELLSSLSVIEPAPEGMTPIGASLDALTGDLAAADGYTAVLLVSDGGENCGGDPVASALALAQSNPNLRIHVIGFDIGDEAASTTLREIARVGNGSYFDAQDMAGLTESLQEAVKLSYRVLNDAGDVISIGLVGGAPVELPAGSYRVLLDSAGAAEVGAEVVPGGQVFFELTPDGAGLTASGV